MEPTATDAEPQQDLIKDIPELDSTTGSQGFIPESLFFWRRWRHSEPA